MKNRMTIEFINVVALMETLKKHNDRIEHFEIKDDEFFLTISRYTMDCNGYFLGYEYYTGAWKVFEGKNINYLGIQSIPEINKWIIYDNFDVTVQNIDTDSEYYSGADEDFAYSDIWHLLRELLENDLLEEFGFFHEKDGKKRVWTIGDLEFPLGDV